MKLQSLNEASIEIVVPVYNEAAVLETQINKLVYYLTANFPLTWRVTIVDNGSTDGTFRVAQELCHQHASVSAVGLDRKGRGGAIRHAWMESDSTICCFMDVDLSTDLSALLPLVAQLLSGHSDISIGNRFSGTSNVAPGPRRELISRIYNLMIRVLFAVRFADAQCGFKAIRTDVARKLLPAIVNDQWFFDTELLLLAEHNGLRIHEILVDWIDDPDTRVHVRSVALEDIRGLLRMALTFISGGGKVDLGSHKRETLTNDLGRQLVSFAKIGFLSTLVSLGLFLLLIEEFHPAISNLLVLLFTTPMNFWLNRRFTFGHRTRVGRWRRYMTGIATFLGLIVFSSYFLTITDESSHWVSALVATTCWISSAALRFKMLRTWAFGSHKKVNVV